MKAIFAIAWADCVLKNEEKRLLSEIISYLNPPSDIGEQIYLYFETPIDVGEVNWSCISASGKYFLLTCAWLMANIDKHLNSREEMIFSQMTFSMGLNSQDLEIIKKGNINNEQKSLLKCLGISGEIA